MKKIQTFIMAFAFVALIFAVPVALMAEQKQIGDDSYEVYPGDLVQLPYVPGNAMAIIYGDSAIWYDVRDEWFHPEVIRNYTTQVYFQIPRIVTPGDYQLYQIKFAEGTDPTRFTNWKWSRTFNIRIKSVCTGFLLC